MTFSEWLKHRKTNTAFEKFLIGLAKTHKLIRYRDFVLFFHHTYRNLPVYFDKSSPMCEANFSAALESFTKLYDEFESVRYRKNP